MSKPTEICRNRFQDRLGNKISEKLHQNLRSEQIGEVLPIDEIFGRARSPNPIGRRLLS